MESARCCIGSGAKLATGVQLSENHFNTAEAGLWLDVYWNATGFVSNLDAEVLVQNDFDAVSVPGKSLINGVVDDLPKTVH